MVLGEIHGNPDRLDSRIHPVPDVSADQIQHIEIKQADTALSLQCRDKLHWRNHSAGLNPSNQSLRSADCVRRRIHLGLIKCNELLILQCVGEALRYFLLAHGVFQHIGLKGHQLLISAPRILHGNVRHVDCFHHAFFADAGIAGSDLHREIHLHTVNINRSMDGDNLLTRPCK